MIDTDLAIFCLFVGPFSVAFIGIVVWALLGGPGQDDPGDLLKAARKRRNKKH